MNRIHRETAYQYPAQRPAGADTSFQQQREALLADLRNAQVREQLLLIERQELARRQAMFAEEFEHRLMNSLHLVSSLLSLQSRAATSQEAKGQLHIASLRVAALGRVHHRLHLLDNLKTVEFGQYLKNLCEDLTGLLFENEDGFAVKVEAMKADISTFFAIPLGFLVNELITNASKYADGNIIVRFENIAPCRHSISVSDDGPGLPEDFDPMESKGLGMKIVRALVKQIGGELAFSKGENGCGTSFHVLFNSDNSAQHGT